MLYQTPQTAKLYVIAKRYCYNSRKAPSYAKTHLKLRNEQNVEILRNTELVYHIIQCWFLSCARKRFEHGDFMPHNQSFILSNKTEILTKNTKLKKSASDVVRSAVCRRV